jgi:two-component system sensor histidine kinase VicK
MSNLPADIQADIEAVSRIPIVESILEVVCRSTGMGFAAVARVTEDRWIACSVRDEISFGLVPGGELQLETTICNEIRQNGEPVIIDHVAQDECFMHHHTPAMYGFQSYISVPIFLKNGSFFGTLCAIDPRPAILKTPQTSGMFKLFAELISFHLNAAGELSRSEEKLIEEHNNSLLKDSLNRELERANHELNVIQGHLENVISKLMDSEERLKQAIDTGRMGTWSIDPETLKVTMSEFIKEMFGFSQNEEVQIAQIMNAIHPEYHQMLNSVLSNAIEKGESSDTEYSITNQQTGEVKWVRATGKVFNDTDGKPAEYSGLFMDITERKLDDLRKNDFIGMVSHELKTPLTTLSAYVQMLQNKAQKTDDVFTTAALDKVSNQVKKMSSMINSFLNVSRLDSGKIFLDKENFLLSDLLQDMIQEAKLTVSGHRITLVPCEPVTITADREKIASVISNLLSNAVKYSPRGEVIEIQYSKEIENVTISVRDEGMGIKPQHLEKLFDRFYRVETKHTQHISGFGIGLYLSAEIVQRHGGKIWVDSEIGKGSTFYFSLPLV